MSAQAESQQQSRILFIKNLNYGVTGADLYKLFGSYGAIRQVRLGDVAGKTRGTAFVVFDEIGDAKSALDHLNGFHLMERYIVGE
jgi:pre-mRNA branch site protein p14